MVALFPVDSLVRVALLGGFLFSVATYAGVNAVVPYELHYKASDAHVPPR